MNEILEQSPMLSNSPKENYERDWVQKIEELQEEIKAEQLKKKVDASYIIGHSLASGIKNNTPVGINQLRGIAMSGMNFKRLATSSNGGLVDYDTINSDQTIKNLIIYLGNNDYNNDWNTDDNSRYVYNNVLQLIANINPKKSVYVVSLAIPSLDVGKNEKQREFVDKTNSLLRENAFANGYVFIEDLIGPNAEKLHIKQGDIHPVVSYPYYEQLFNLLFDKIE